MATGTVHNIRIGLPSFVFQELRVSEVPEFDINHLEIGFEDTSRSAEFVELCVRRGWSYSVHIPCPKHSDKRVRHFSPATASVQFGRESLDITLETLSYWSRSGATHVVMHFPNANAIDRSENHVLDERAATAFLNTVTDAAETANLQIAIENLSTNPRFWSARHYLEALGSYDRISFCLDVGHAFQAGGLGASFDFVDLMGPRLTSCHLYDYRLDGSNYFHECFVTPDETFFGASLGDITTRLLAANRDIIFVHEAGNAATSAGVRSLQRSLSFLRECAA